MDSIPDKIESNVIEFNAKMPSKVFRFPQKYPDLIKYEAEFSIIIDGELFFNEPNFPLFEFLYFANKWKGTDATSFHYSSIDTEDNPLISFEYANDMFTISSPWQLFECRSRFTKNQLTDALNDIVRGIK